MLHHILVPFSRLWGFLLLKSFPGAGWYLHPEQKGRWARGIQHTKLGMTQEPAGHSETTARKIPCDLFLALGISLKLKKKSRWRAMPLYFWPLAKLQRNYCFRGRAGASSLPCLENKTLLLGWMCSWVGINGFYSFLALWHVHFFFFFASCLSWASLGLQTTRSWSFY